MDGRKMGVEDWRYRFVIILHWAADGGGWLVGWLDCGERLDLCAEEN